MGYQSLLHATLILSRKPVQVSISNEKRSYVSIMTAEGNTYYDILN